MFCLQTENDYNYLLDDKKFMFLKSYKERIKYVLTKVEPLSKLMQDVFEKADLYQMKHRKSPDISKSFRCEGRYHFERKQFKAAKDCFTNAILTSPFPEECPLESKDELSLCYVYRSMAFFLMNSYDSALFDIKQSLHFSESVQTIYQKINCIFFANEFKHNLCEYFYQCILRINTKEFEENASLAKENLEQFEPIKIMDFDCRQNINEENTKQLGTQELTNLWVHPNIEIKTSIENGRYLVTKHNICANTLIVRERLSNLVFFGQNIYEYCSFCHKQIGEQIFPCRYCDEVVFCSQKCGQLAVEGTHRYECGKTGLIFQLGSNALQVFRIFCEFGSKTMSFETNRKAFSFEEYIREESQQTNTERSESHILNRFRFICELVDHSDKHIESDFINNTFKAIETTIFLYYCKVLNPDTIYDIKSFVSFATKVSSYLNRMSNNVFGWFVDKEDDSSNAHVANFLCLCSALINHSCDPNINWYFEDNYICFKTNRYIKEEEEMNITYGPHELSPLIERQINLKANYYFVCNCKVCLRSIFTVQSLKCPECGGPVIYKTGTDLNSCLQCRQQYQNKEKVIKKVDILLNNLKQNIEKMVKDIDRVEALESAKNTIELLKELVHKSSCDLLKYIRQLMKLCLHFSEIQSAIDLSKHLLPLIECLTLDSKHIFSVVFDDLFLLTRIYYNYLFDNQTENKTEWGTAQHIFNITINLLERVKQRKLSEEIQDSDSSLDKCVEKLSKQLQELKAKETENFNICQTNCSPLSTKTQFLSETKEITSISITSAKSSDSSESLSKLSSTESLKNTDLSSLEEQGSLSSRNSVLSIPSTDSSKI